MPLVFHFYLYLFHFRFSLLLLSQHFVSERERTSIKCCVKSAWKQMNGSKINLENVSLEAVLCWQHHLHISLRRIINISVDNLFFVLRFSLRPPSSSLNVERLWKKLAFNLTWQLLRLHFTILNKSTICWPTSGKFQLICKCDSWNQYFTGYLQVCVCVCVWDQHYLVKKHFEFSISLHFIISFA